MGYNWAKKKMKKSIIVLGLSVILACGTLFATNSQSKTEEKTEIVSSSLSGDCVSWKFRDNNGYDEVKITNNCSSEIKVSYKYWNGKDRWVSVSFRVGAGQSSLWWPANSLKDFNYEFVD